MSEWTITSPWIFFGVAGAVVAYVLYMMVSRRQGQEQDGEPGRGREL
jgi:hypothetical protein